MAMRTKKEIVQEILYELFGGIPSVDASISENFVLRKLNNKIASSAVQQTLLGYKLEGVYGELDIFTLTFTGLALSTNANTGLKYVDLPVQPIYTPLNQSITVFAPAPRGGMLNDLFKPTTRRKLTMVRSLPNLKKVYYFVENGQVIFEDEWQIMATFTSVGMSIVTSGTNDLLSFLNLPDDAIDLVKKECLLELRGMMQLSDTTPLPVADTPQPRD